MTSQDLKFVEILEVELGRLDSERDLIIKKRRHLKKLIKTYKQP